MADNQLLGITDSLFGVKPKTFESDFAAALPALRGMSATDIGTAAAYAGAKQLGRGLMGAAGIEDPDMASANRAKQFAAELSQQGISMQSSQGMKALAQKLSQAGDFKAAQAASALAMNFEEKEAKTKLTQAQTVKALREPDEGVKALIQKSTPASVAKYMKTGNPADLELIDKGLTGANLEKVASAEKANESLSLGNTEIIGFLKDLKEGKVVYGPISNIIAKGTAAFGSPTDNALKQQEIESFITGSINDVLNSAKGVQAKDDALRAERQIKGYLAMNSNDGVKKALERLQKVKEDTIKSNQTYIDVLTKGKGSGITPPTGVQSGKYADDYAKYKDKYGAQALPYDAYVAKREGR